MNVWSAILKRYTKPLTKPVSQETGPDYRVTVFENLRFYSSTHKHENGVFENLHSGERPRKPPFSHAKTPFTCRHNAKTEKKRPFIIISAYVWTGNNMSYHAVNRVDVIYLR